MTALRVRVPALLEALGATASVRVNEADGAPGEWIPADAGVNRVSVSLALHAADTAVSARIDAELRLAAGSRATLDVPGEWLAAALAPPQGDDR